LRSVQGLEREMERRVCRRYGIGGSLAACLRASLRACLGVMAIMPCALSGQEPQVRRHAVHDVLSIAVPEGKVVRPYASSDVRMVAIVSDAFEMQIAYGEGSSIITDPHDVRLRRTEALVDGRPATIEMWRLSSQRRRNWPLELRGHIEGPAGAQVDARMWCRTEKDCADAENIFRSMVFLTKGSTGAK
jgi:hypothetical protein